MTRRLIFSYLSITAFVLLILEIPLGVTFARSERDRLEAAIERDARVLATFAEDILEGRPGADLQGRIEEYEEETGARVVIVDDAGVSIADSENPGTPRQFLSPTRPEFELAIREGLVTTGSRYSETLGQRILYVAVPVTSGGSVFGAVRITFPAGDLESRIRRNTLSLGLLAAVVMLSTAGVGALLARSVTRPMRSLEVAVAAIAGGDLAARAPVDAGPTEVRTLARQFNDMATRLEELMRAQRAFVADASHELRTPLTALRLRIENLASADPVEMRRDVEMATEEIGRLARLVEGLLALARTEGDRPERVAVDIAQEAAERVEAWQALAEEQGVDLTVESDGAARGLVVPGAIAQVLDNLLANALEVAPGGSTVTVRTSRANGRVEVHVIDEGPGLSDEERSRAFDRFWRAAGAAPGQGSGLGLAIVAQLAAACGGTAQIGPGPGSGCDASVSIPAAAP